MVVLNRIAGKEWRCRCGEQTVDTGVTEKPGQTETVALT